MEKKIDAILKMAPPKNVEQLRGLTIDVQTHPEHVLSMFNSVLQHFQKQNQTI